MTSNVTPSASVPSPRQPDRAPRVMPSASACRQLIQSVSQLAVFFLDTGGVVRTWNQGARCLLGHEGSDIVGQHFSVLYPPDAVAHGHPRVTLEIAASTGHCEETGWRLNRDGSQLWAHVVITALWNTRGEPCGFGQIMSDLTAQKQVEDELKSALSLVYRAARIDILTGLPNRRSFEESLDAELSAARRHHRPLTVGVIDLDHFKRVNDVHGHDAGDSLLRRMSFSWRQCLRPTDVLARYGGEEFAVIMSDTDLASGVAVLERLRLSTPDSQTCSIGAAEWDVDEPAARLLARADRAMYVAKSSGRDRLVTDDAYQTKPTT